MPQAMLPKDRVDAVFNHQPTDKVPIYQAGFSSRVASAVLGREAYVGGGIQQYREAKALWEGEDAHAEYIERSERDAFDLIHTLDLDLVRPAYWRWPTKPTEKIDENTFLFGDRTESYRVMTFNPELELFQELDSGPPVQRTFDDLEKQVEAMEAGFERYQPKRESFATFQAAIDEFGDHRGIPGSGTGVCIPRETIWLEAVALRPELVARFLMCQAMNATKVVPIMKEMGLLYLFGGGDFASQKGPFISPKSFRELQLPAQQVVSEACDEHGCWHLFASDGDLWPIADDLFGKSGIRGFYEIDRRAGMDLGLLRDRFPHLTLLGGIESETLHMGTVPEVIDHVKTALDVARERGSCIIGCSNQIVAPTPIENFWAMMETLKDHR